MRSGNRKLQVHRTASTNCTAWDWVDNDSSAIIGRRYVERFGDPIECLYLIVLSLILVNGDRLCVFSMFAFSFMAKKT